MSPSAERALTKRIVEFYEDPENEWAHGFFRWAKDRKNDSSITTVERLVKVAQLTRRQAVTLLRNLDEMKCGRFVVGRHGQKSRMEWAYSIRSIGEVALGEDAALHEIDQEPVENIDEEERGVEHHFELAPGRKVVIQLPVDFSKEEAVRVAKLIQALPTED